MAGINPNLPGAIGPLAVAVVVDAPVLPDDQDALFVGQSDVFIYPDYKINNRFEKDGKIYMLGLTSPDGFNGDTVSFVKLANSTVLWIADWTAVGGGDIPEIPDPRPMSQSGPWVLMDDMLEPATLRVWSNGSAPYYRISGTYVYGCKRPSVFLIQDASIPSPPWLDSTGLLRTIPATKLKQGIINDPAQGNRKP